MVKVGLLQLMELWIWLFEVYSSPILSGLVWYSGGLIYGLPP